MNKIDLKTYLNKLNIKTYTPLDEIMFLLELIQKNTQKNEACIIEIGTANMGTTIPIAMMFSHNDVITIDIYNSDKVNYHSYLKNYRIILKENIKNIILIYSSSDVFGKLFNGEIDFLWIDGNHKYEFVKKDIQIWSKKLKKGCIIAGHDYNHPAGVGKAVDELIKNNSQFDNFGIYKTIWYAKKIK